MIEIVPATLEHIKALYPEVPKATVRAFAAVDGERVLGVSGIYRDCGQMVVFAKLTDELRNNKRALIKGARKVMEMFKGKTLAVCDAQIEKSAEFLMHFGFVKITGEVFSWNK